MGTRDAVERACKRWPHLSDRQRAATLGGLLRWYRDEDLVRCLADLVARAACFGAVDKAGAVASWLALPRDNRAWRLFERAWLERAERGSTPVRRAAVSSISLVEDRLRRKLDILMAALLDDDEDLRVSAGVQLSLVGRPAIRRLVRALADPRYQRKDDSLWKVIMTLDSLVTDERVADEAMLYQVAAALKEFAICYRPRGPDDDAHWKAVESLGRHHIGGEIGTEALAEIARRAEQRVAGWALDELTELNGDPARSALSTLAKGEGARAKRAAAALRRWERSHDQRSPA